MNIFNKGFIAALVASSFCISTQAADTSITINGKVTAAACTVDSSGTYSITMPDATAATLSTTNSYGDWAPLDVTVSSCPVGTTSVTAKFSGTADSADANKYANTTGAGYSTNVSVQLQNRSGTIADKGKDSTMTAVIDGSRKATFDLRARPFSTSGNTTVGNIKTVVMMDFTYN